MNLKKYTAFYNVVYFFFYYLRSRKREQRFDRVIKQTF
jgi:hypothetical protein